MGLVTRQRQFQRMNVLAATALELHGCFSPNLKFLKVHKNGSAEEKVLLREKWGERKLKTVSEKQGK